MADQLAREQLLQARSDIRHKIEAQQTSSRSFNHFLNADRTTRLHDVLADISEMLGEDVDA